MTPEQRQAAIAEMLEKHPGLAALVPRTLGVHRAERSRMVEPKTG
jgi:hypothetical protein